MSIPENPWTSPTSDDVATLLRARTKDLDGNEVGVFNDYTRPTAAEVDRIIAMAYAEISALAGASIGDRCAGTARWLTTLRAAMWVELSYWPEQVRSDRSVYAELAEQWTTGLPQLRECIAGNLPDDGGDTNAGYRFGTLDVHGWTASPYYAAPVVPEPVPEPTPVAEALAHTPPAYRHLPLADTD